MDLRRGLVVLAVLLVIVGVVCLAAGILYYLLPASSIPSFLPGHLAGVAAHRSRRGLALVILAAVVWVAALGVGVGAIRRRRWS